MGAPQLHLPQDALERFVGLYRALIGERSWADSGDTLRYAALALTPLPGPLEQVAARLTRLAADLDRGTAWYKRSPLRFLIAALLLRYGDSASDFLAEVKRAGALFRERWKLSGETHEALAILVLRQESVDRRVSADQVARLAAIWEEMKRHHPWLTQKSDWPACALLATTPMPPAQIGERLEALYQGLRDRGFPRGDALQTASHILFFHVDSPLSAVTRFAQLYEGFKESGLWMVEGDYDEIALLAFTTRPAAEVVELVRAHRARIAELKPRPSKQTSFSLACGTALLQLVRRSADRSLLSEAQALIQITTILQAQQAAVAAAVAASSAAAAG